MKYYFCLCVYSQGKLSSIRESRHGFVCMSLPKSGIVELFHV